MIQPDWAMWGSWVRQQYFVQGFVLTDLLGSTIHGKLKRQMMANAVSPWGNDFWVRLQDQMVRCISPSLHLSHWFAEQCCFTMDWVATKIPHHKRFAPHSDWATGSWIRHNHNILSKDLIYKFVWFIIHGKLKVNHIHLMASEAISIQWSVRENCMHAHQHKQFESHMCTYGYLFQIYYWSGIQTLNNEEEGYLEEETTQ